MLYFALCGSLVVSNLFVKQCGVDCSEHFLNPVSTKFRKRASGCFFIQAVLLCKPLKTGM